MQRSALREPCLAYQLALSSAPAGTRQPYRRSCRTLARRKPRDGHYPPQVLPHSLQLQQACVCGRRKDAGVGLRIGWWINNRKRARKD